MSEIKDLKILLIKKRKMSLDEYNVKAL